MFSVQIVFGWKMLVRGGGRNGGGGNRRFCLMYAGFEDGSVSIFVHRGGIYTVQSVPMLYCVYVNMNHIV